MKDTSIDDIDLDGERMPNNNLLCDRYYLYLLSFCMFANMFAIIMGIKGIIYIYIKIGSRDTFQTKGT